MGYWPSAKSTRKKDGGQNLAVSTEQGWSIKDLSYEKRTHFLQAVLNGQDSSTLPAPVAINSIGFVLSCLLT